MMRRVLTIVAVAAVATLACLFTTAAHAQMFEHEAGTSDWHQQHIGTISFSVETESHLVVATRDGVVAALNPTNGAIVWRRVLRESVDTIDQLLHHNSAVFVISGAGRRVLSLNALNGVLFFDEMIHAHEAVDVPSSQVPTPVVMPGSDTATRDNGFVAACLVDADRTTVLSVLSQGALTFLSAASGSVRWVPELPEGASMIALACSDSGTVSVIEKTDAQLALSTFDISTKEIKTHDVEGVSSAADAWSYGSTFVIMDGQTLSYAAADHADGSVTLASPTQLPENAKSLLKMPSARCALVAFESGVTQAYAVENDGSLAVVGTIPASESVFSAPASLDHSPFIASAISSMSDAKATFGTSSVHTDVSDLSIASSHVAHATCTKKHGICLLALADGTTVGFTFTGTREWVRHEGLAHSITTAFLDLPLSSNEDAIFDNPNPVARLFLRVQKFIADVVGVVVPSGSTDMTMVQDNFNTKKMIVTVSEFGRIHAICSESGQTLWMTSPYADHVLVGGALHEVRAMTHKSPLIALVSRMRPVADIAQMPGHDAEQTVVVLINPTTGEITQKKKLGSKLLHSMTLPHVHVDAHTAPVLVATEDGRVHVLPEGTVVTKAFVEATKNVYFHHVDAVKGTISGYKALFASSDTTAGEHVRLWSVAFDPDEERIAAVAMANKEKVSSVGEVLGDKGVLYKYLNPNILAVATLTPYVKKSATLTIYLLDTVKGTFVHRVEHDHVRGPVHISMADNWVMYSYRKRSEKRYELSVLEMFDSSSKEKESGEPFSSLETSMPIFVSQSYVFPSQVTAMGVSTTKQGLTEKKVVLGLGTDHLYAMNKRHFDARRPHGPKAKELNVGLVDYNPVMPLAFPNIISYNKTVSRVKLISTGATGLESTSLVFAQGLDSYFISVTPSGRFDILDPHLNKGYLLLAMAGMVAAAVVLRKLKERKDVAKLWA